MLPLLTDKLKPLSDYVIVDISDSIIGNVDKRVEALGVEEAFNEELVYLDCTRYDKEGKFRLMETIGVPYSVELGKAIYIINAYQYDGVNKLLERHQMNLEYEKEHPPVTYKDKNLKQPKERKERKVKEPKEKKPKMTKLEKKIAGFAFNPIKL